MFDNLIGTAAVYAVVLFYAVSIDAHHVRSAWTSMPDGAWHQLAADIAATALRGILNL